MVAVGSAPAASGSGSSGWVASGNSTDVPGLPGNVPPVEVLLDDAMDLDAHKENNGNNSDNKDCESDNDGD